jgi:hypothetical protein
MTLYNYILVGLVSNQPLALFPSAEATLLAGDGMATTTAPAATLAVNNITAVGHTAYVPGDFAMRHDGKLIQVYLDTHVALLATPDGFSGLSNMPGTPVTVANASFESPSANSAPWYAAGPISGWTYVGDSDAVYTLAAGHYVSNVPDGVQCVDVVATSDALTATLTSNPLENAVSGKIYRLAVSYAGYTGESGGDVCVALGYLNGGTFTSLAAATTASSAFPALVAGITPTTLPTAEANMWQVTLLAVTAPSAANGYPLVIVLASHSPGGQIDMLFDNVILKKQ